MTLKLLFYRLTADSEVAAGRGVIRSKRGQSAGEARHLYKLR